MTVPSEVLARMVSPGQRRPDAYRGGIIQLMLGRACNLACVGCTQGSQLAGRAPFMTPEQADVALRSLEGYWGVVGFFGGSPTLSPHFKEICSIARRYFPREQLGLWSNNLHGKGAIARATFNPAVSNLNMHMSHEAAAEFRRDWPESAGHLVGLAGESRHSPPWVAMRDMQDMTDAERWSLVATCDVNQKWSALVGVIGGEVLGYFCEIAYAQAALHEGDPEWPVVGVPAVPGWWQQPMGAFRAQVEQHCMACGVPLKGRGDLAVTGTVEHVSETHASIFKLKRPAGKTVVLACSRADLGGSVGVMTQYIQNAKE